MAICHSFIRTSVKKSGFILTVMLFQLLFFSALCVYALEAYVVHVRLADNYLNFYEKNVELENKIIQVRQPMQLIASLPCLSAQFYQAALQEKSLTLSKIIAVPYHGECKGKLAMIKYGVQAIYPIKNSAIS